MFTVVIASSSFLAGCMITVAASAAARRWGWLPLRTRRAARAAQSSVRFGRRAAMAEVIGRNTSNPDDLAATYAAAAQYASAHRPTR